MCPLHYAGIWSAAHAAGARISSGPGATMFMRSSAASRVVHSEKIMRKCARGGKQPADLPVDRREL
jgi:hypothetical protein